MDEPKHGKNKSNSKQTWLDWLRDEPPAADAQAELRERFKQQANSYRPVNRSLQGQQPAQPVHKAPVQPHPSVAAPQSPVQPQVVSDATHAPNSSTAAPGVPQSAAPATVSIQIHFPALGKGFHRLFAKLKQGSTVGKQWFMHQLAVHKARTLTISIGLPALIVLLLLPPLLNFGYGKPKTASGGSSGSSTGASTTYDKPTFEVVTPSTKTKLATPDGVHAAYDGAKNVYTYGDTIGGNGFTVSQQPIPPQFSDGLSAVESIAPTLNKGVTPVKLNVITGTAYVSTNPKYNSQSLVLNVRDVLVFIQSSHAFTNSEWESYINTLQ
jgi:hypothetical protein